MSWYCNRCKILYKQKPGDRCCVCNGKVNETSYDKVYLETKGFHYAEKAASTTIWEPGFSKTEHPDPDAEYADRQAEKYKIVKEAYVQCVRNESENLKRGHLPPDSKTTRPNHKADSGKRAKPEYGPEEQEKRLLRIKEIEDRRKRLHMSARNRKTDPDDPDMLSGRVKEILSEFGLQEENL